MTTDRSRACTPRPSQDRVPFNASSRSSRSQLPSLLPIMFRGIVERALLEDLGRAGDVTSDAIVGAREIARARVVAREAGRVAGIAVAAEVFRMLEPSIEVVPAFDDGEDAAAGAEILTLSGSARAVLAGERTALNLLGRMCGIATLTRRFVEAVEPVDPIEKSELAGEERAGGTGRPRIVCTRKTTPGLRVLEKYAVRCGGGSNHRFGLDDAVLIKDNHVALAGGVAAALERVRSAAGHMVKVEIEVETLDQLDEALASGADAVLLDNMDLETLAEAVRRVGGRAVTEASGGIDLESAAAVAATGVDLLSVGALTHSARCLDVSMEIVSMEIVSMEIVAGSGRG